MCIGILARSNIGMILFVASKDWGFFFAELAELEAIKWAFAFAKDSRWN